MNNRFTRPDNPRQIRFEASKYYRRILDAVFVAKYATVHELGLFYSPTNQNACREDLRALWENQYLDKRKVGPADPDVYYIPEWLDRPGRKRVASNGLTRLHTDLKKNVPLEKLHRMCHVELRGIPNYLHHRAIAKFYVKFVLEMEEVGAEFTACGDPELSTIPRLNPVPDILASVQLNGVMGDFAIEVDRNADPAKLDAYEKYINERIHEKVFGHPTETLTILIVAEDLKEANKWQRYAQKMVHHHFIRICTLEDVRKPFQDKIWMTPKGQERVSIL